jgi:hypothetical protein
MRCRRIRRELLWLARFGEFGPSSQPHLDHLAGCRACRDEVGFDRAMVEQLRIALAERIAHASPSPRAFERILARTQRPEPRPAARLLGWSSALVGRLRFATAMAGTGLALVAALNMDIVPIAAPARTDASVTDADAALMQVPRIPPPRDNLAAFAREWRANEGTPARPDPETALTPVGRVPLSVLPSTELRLVFRASQTPEPVVASVGSAPRTGATTSSGPATEPGEPS